MDKSNAKPKLVFLQFRYDDSVPEFLLIHKREHVSCLSQFFQVTVISEDCDYGQICDKYEPDLVLFESGLEVQRSHRLNIGNVRSRPEVPRVAFHNADGCSDFRAGIISDMEHWGIETFFSISVGAAEHTPQIAGGLFVWPNFIDAQVYRDYGESKVIPVVLTGSQSPRYPWRHKVYRLISARYPSLLCPHAGYLSRSTAGQMLYGEQYARTINASMFGPTCGTVTKELVRKHLEFPGCRSCLVTERSPGLEAAGFVDMHNCVFADEGDVVEKLGYLFEHQDELSEITDRGFQLVHSRHTSKHRDQILQWFNLRMRLRSDQKIVQLSPFGALTIVDKSSGIENIHVISDGVHFKHFREAEQLLWSGRYEEAERSYLKCLSYLSEFPEAKVRLALCNLYKGNPRVALSWIVQPIQATLARYKAIDPDPVEWAYFIVCLLCLGKPRAAVKRSRQFAGLRHPELVRARWAVALLTGNAGAVLAICDQGQARRASVHQVPDRSLKEWIGQICIMLDSCKRPGSARALRIYLDSGRPSAPTGVLDAGREDHLSDAPGTDAGARLPANASNDRGRKPTLRRFDHPDIWYRVGRKMLRHSLDVLRRIEQRWGYFLPYNLSEMRNDEFFKAILELSQGETIANALLIGASVGQGCTEALLTGTARNPNKPVVFCVSGSGPRYRRSNRTNANVSRVKWYDVSADQHGSVQQDLEDTIKGIMEEHGLDFFDAVVIDSDTLGKTLEGRGSPLKELHRTKLVLLDDVSGPYNYKTQRALRTDSSYELLAENPSLRNGYAIFRKVAGVNAPVRVSAIAE